MMSASDNMNLDFNFEEEIPEEESGLETHASQSSGNANMPEDTRSEVSLAERTHCLSAPKSLEGPHTDSEQAEILRDRRLLLQAFRAQALQREIHERYAPLRPSPLRNEITREDLSDSEVSDGDGETTDDPQTDQTLRYDGPESDSGGAEGSNSAGSSSGSSSDE